MTPRLRPSRHVVVLLAGVAVFLIVLTRGKAAAFVYDAQVYWMLTEQLTHGHLPHLPADIDLRGIWTAVVYLPAALIANLAPGYSPQRLVLLENALLIALLAVVILPAIIRRITPAGGCWPSLACAALVTVIVRGFAPYPLMDLSAAVVAFAAIALLLKPQRWWVVVLSGVLFGIAVNLRPAYLIPSAFGYAVWLYRAAWPGALLPLAGVAIALIPQVAANVIQYGSWLAVPVASGVVRDLQFQYAGYITRYDTLIGSAITEPRQFFCDPSQAASLAGQSIHGAAALLGHLARQAPSSLLFLGRKIGASLLWSPATPYAQTSTGALTALSLFVLLVSAAGITALAVGLVRHGQRDRHPVAVLLAFTLGSVATVAGSTPEARFALPIVMAGVLGCAAAPSLVRAPLGQRRTRIIIVGISAAAAWAVFLMLGLSGLAHPAPPGGITAEICALVQ